MTFDKITSTRNSLAQTLRSLSERKGRLAHDLMLVEGEKMIREAADAGLRCAALLYDERRAGELDALINRLHESGAEVHPVTDNVLDAVCDTRTPQGCCAAFALPRPLAGDDLADRLVALDGVQDPGNVGAIWRTADAAGFQALVLGAGCADPFSPKVQRAAMGSGFRIPVAMEEDLGARLSALRGAGYQVIISSLDGAPFYAREPLGEKYVLVIGSEARGVCPSVSREATLSLKLPMRGGAESLNASVAAGIMMYELTKNL